MKIAVKWCCAGFEGWAMEGGNRGLAIVLDWDQDAGRPIFTLQFRAVDAGKEASVKTEVPIDAVADVEIQFCPWCGRLLRDWYNVEVVKELAQPGLRVANQY